MNSRRHDVTSDERFVRRTLRHHVIKPMQFTPREPHFYIVKLLFSGVYIISLLSAYINQHFMIYIVLVLLKCHGTGIHILHGCVYLMSTNQVDYLPVIWLSATS